MRGVNDQGLPVGEGHPGAKLTDNDVRLIRELADSGMRYKDIAAKFDVTRGCVGRIARFERRWQQPTRYVPIGRTRRQRQVDSARRRQGAPGVVGAVDAVGEMDAADAADAVHVPGAGDV